MPVGTQPGHVEVAVKDRQTRHLPRQGGIGQHLDGPERFRSGIIGGQAQVVRAVEDSSLMLAARRGIVGV